MWITLARGRWSMFDALLLGGKERLLLRRRFRVAAVNREGAAAAHILLHLTVSGSCFQEKRTRQIIHEKMPNHANLDLARREVLRRTG
jgi:hypothetical protein